MKTDLYTKIVLTVIAVALIGVVVQNVSLTPTAHAQSDETMNVRIVAIRKPALVTDLPGFGNWDALNTAASDTDTRTIDVNIEQVNGRSIYGSAVPVSAE